MNKPRLILHIGTHKTGTTGIQRFCSANRTTLLHQGILYPSYSLIQEKEHYAHHHMAHGLANKDTNWTFEKVRHMLQTAAEHCPRTGTVFLSAEPFYRHVLTANDRNPAYLADSEYWSARSRYIEVVSRALSGFDVEVLGVFRRQPNYFNSLYQEVVKVTRYKGSALEFYLMKRHEFDYMSQMEAWAAHFPRIRVLVFEDLAKEGSLVHNFLNIAIGRSLNLPEATAKANTSLHPSIIEFKLLLNSLPDNPAFATFSKVDAAALQKLEAYAIEQGMISAADRRHSYLSLPESQLLTISWKEANRQLRNKFFPEGSQELEKSSNPTDLQPTPKNLEIQTVSHLMAKLADLIKAP